MLNDDPTKDLVSRLKILRKYYCTGPCGQSSSVLQTRSTTRRIIDDVIRYVEDLEAEIDILRKESDN